MNILVINRAFNDIDHISPILYKLLQRGHNITVLIVDETLDYENDYRLDFLRKNGANIESIIEYSNYKYIKHILKILKLLYKNKKQYSYFLKKMYLGILDRFSKNIEFDIDKFMNNKNFDVILFDWTNPISNEIKAIPKIFSFAKSKNIKVFSLPHGLSIYLNCDITNDKIENGTHSYYNHYDKVVSNNLNFTNCLIQKGVNSSNIVTLGSARFCNEWINIHNKIYPKKNLKLDATKINIVFFPQQSQYKVNLKLQLEFLEKLNELNKYNIIFKPHTRNHNESFFKTIKQLDNVYLVDNNIVSSLLIDISDIVIAYGSSIVLEAVFKSKLVVYPKFLHNNQVIFDRVNASMKFDNINDIINFFKNPKKNYPYENENAVLLECAYCNKTDDVLNKISLWLENNYKG